MSAKQKHIEIADAAINIYAERQAKIQRIKYLMNNSYRLIKRLCKRVNTTVDYCVNLLLNDDGFTNDGISVWRAIEIKIIEIRVDRIKDSLEPVDGIANTCIGALLCRYIDIA